MTTYARIVTGQLKTTTIDEGVRAFNEKVTPDLRKQPGFKSSELLVNHKTGKMASVSHFASEADAQAGGQAGFKERVAMLEPYMDGPAHLEIYEVDARS
jgi:heme-degrading monooxygenase HmoA